MNGSVDDEGANGAAEHRCALVRAALSCTDGCHQASDAYGSSRRKHARPNKSSTLRLTGVPDTHHRLVAGSFAAIAATRLVELSSICASSKHTRHQSTAVNGQGTGAYFFAYRAVLETVLSSAWLSSARSTSYEVITTSYCASSFGRTKPFDCNPWYLQTK
jgi:hypothetical protein